MFALHSVLMNESLKARFQRPEGELIEAALIGPPKRSRRDLAKNVGLSEGRVRQIVNGYRTEAGTILEIQAPADTLVRIATELDIGPSDMRNAGRDDVADLLEERPNVGVTEEGDLWLSTLDDERQQLVDWIASGSTARPPAGALALWTTEQLIEASLRSHRDQLRLSNYIIEALKKRKAGDDNGTQASTQKNLDGQAPLAGQDSSEEPDEHSAAANYDPDAESVEESGQRPDTGTR